MADDDDATDDATELAPLPMHEALLAALVANPHDDAAWMVFEDWILGLGDDPREPVIVRERAGQPTGMAARDVAKRLLGPRSVRVRISRVRSRAGMLLQAGFDAFTGEGEGLLPAFVAQPGVQLLTSLAVHADTFEPLAELAPLARTLETLTINGRGDVFDTALLAPFARLRELEAGRFERIAGDATALGRLGSVTLHFAGAIELVDLAHAPLAGATRVELHGIALAADGLRAALPAVRLLTVRVGDLDRAAEAATVLVASGLVPQLASVAIETHVDRASVGPDVRARFRGGAFAHVGELVLPRALVTRERGSMVS